MISVKSQKNLLLQCNKSQFFLEDAQQHEKLIKTHDCKKVIGTSVRFIHLFEAHLCELEVRAKEVVFESLSSTAWISPSSLSQRCSALFGHLLVFLEGMRSAHPSIAHYTHLDTHYFQHNNCPLCTQSISVVGVQVTYIIYLACHAALFYCDPPGSWLRRSPSLYQERDGSDIFSG